MTEFAEVIYENGDKSTVQVDNRDELFAGLAEHHRRAVNGEPSYSGDTTGVAGGRIPPAIRVKRVLMYDEHPGSFTEDNLLPSDEIKAAVSDYLKAAGDVVNVNELAAFIRDHSNAIQPTEHVHDSQYKMPEKEEVAPNSFMDTETGELTSGKNGGGQ